MPETSVHGACHRESSGDRPNRTKQSPHPPPPLKRSSIPRDFISPLPDAAIHRIFSFLPLRDAVKTSVLSKRWRSTWTTTTDLVFDGEIGALGFPSLVDRVLSQCTSPAVKKFHLTDFRYDEPDRPKVDLWLRFAAGRPVEELHLRPSFFSPVKYEQPQFLYSLSWLARLEVSLCCFSLGGIIRWPCLKTLVIEYSELSDDILEGIFSGSPVLESVQFRGCKGVKNIIIDSTSVKELVLNDHWFSNPDRIWAPHLQSLRVLGRWYHDSMFRLDDVSSLVEAELVFSIRIRTGTLVSDKKRMCCDLVKGFFEKLHGVPTITIGGWCLQILSLLELEGLPSPFFKCQNLRLHGPVSQWDLPGIAYLLKSSQCLEKLDIVLTDLPLQLELFEESAERLNFDEGDFLPSRKGNFEFLVKHLKRVEIIGFGANSFGSKHLLALIKFLLGEALVLEKLIIKTELPTCHGQKCLDAAVLSKLLGTSRNVLRYQRASKIAEVIFDYPFE
ncbi:F-box protein At5g03100-like [Rhodamnia argentea]|uniref:F-box protein At5g03100-like n=1 Tax=Rhodamnia argentea TaxID=178133 RepID=A0ABM3H763_9MYRT|nr:F-box protein At5g03100-like [Rhodamnia argentea]